jgi:hypothetical protein
MANQKNENCESLLPLLSVYVDGEATPDEAALIEAHLDTCKDCASHLAFLRATNFVMAGVPEVAPDAALFARIASATYAKPTLREQIAEKVGAWLRPMPVRYALGSAMAAAIAAIIVVPRFLSNEPVVGPVANGDHHKQATPAVSPLDGNTKLGNDAEGTPEKTPGENKPAPKVEPELNLKPTPSTVAADTQKSLNSAGARLAQPGAMPTSAPREDRKLVAAKPTRPSRTINKPRTNESAPATAPQDGGATVAQGNKASTPANTGMKPKPITQMAAIPMSARADIFRSVRPLSNRGGSDVVRSVTAEATHAPEGTIETTGTRLATPNPGGGKPETTPVVIPVTTAAAPSSGSLVKSFRPRTGWKSGTRQTTYAFNASSVGGSAPTQEQNGLVPVVKDKGERGTN